MLAFNHQIQALLSLMDDTDMEVYSIVTERICQYGKSIIPHLENLWENTVRNEVQERIELLIHQIQYNDLEEAVVDWKRNSGRLVDGAILAARFQYPDLNVEEVKDKIQKLWRTVWLELNDQLTYLEQLHILNSILYHFYKLEGAAYNYKDEEFFLINKVLEKRKGNALSNGILFQVIAEQVGLPIKAVHVPKHYLLAFFSKTSPFLPCKELDSENILFFIDATSGSVYNRADMVKYLKDNDCLSGGRLFEVMENRDIVAYLFREWSSCLAGAGDQYKKEELHRLARILAQKD